MGRSEIRGASGYSIPRIIDTLSCNRILPLGYLENGRIVKGDAACLGYIHSQSAIHPYSIESNSIWLDSTNVLNSYSAGNSVLVPVARSTNNISTKGFPLDEFYCQWM
ncbi:hypothetical protein LguiB_019590 [Lonicera macranthoides]